MAIFFRVTSKPPCAATVFFLSLVSVWTQAAERPNIVFFYADDLGYGDLACYGSPVAQTPVLDQLAREGTRFTQFYVSHCVCSPTRSSAITGQFPSQHRIFGHLAYLSSNRARKMPDWLDVEAPSFPRALQKAGYHTAMIGKWHLGGGSGRTFKREDLNNPDVDHSQESRKITINHPDAPSVDRYGFDHVRTTFGNSPTWKKAEPWPEPHQKYPYLSKEWSTWSSRAIADETIQFLKKHADSKGEQPFYVNVWFKDVHTTLLPTKEMRKPFLSLDEKAQVHYAMVRYMDEQIGRVLEKLNELGLNKNTLVLFSSDNGAKNFGGSNGPLRDWKHSLYEGGIRVPLIVRWPGQVQAGRVDANSVINIVDLVPTLEKLAVAKMPEGYESDGEDVGDAFRGQSFERKKPQFWHYPAKSPALALRIRNWKLLTDPEKKNEQLYDLDTDIGESNNLAEQNPKIVADLRRQLAEWYRKTGLDNLKPFKLD